ncbi:aspartokinase-like uncharacterized kinase [Inquilinus ginsengisoli]|uniref:amino acid kinase family protein n=1 Tax=Inquilinus ginsengisoli TaxID=363840 RepID=UPI003D2244A1
MRPSTPGFVHPDIGCVIKIGGSLTRDLTDASRLVGALAGLARKGLRILVVPGGGRPDKEIEAIDRERPLAPLTAHRACALAQDQTGLILADPGLASGTVACATVGGCLAALAERTLPILLPSDLIFTADPVEPSWDVTSDAIGAWVAWLLRADRYAVVTDVDGVYSAGGVGDPEHLMTEIAAEDLAVMGHTSVDACAAAFIAANALEAAVLNGRHPDRVVDWIERRPCRGTVIRPSRRATA